MEFFAGNVHQSFYLEGKPDKPIALLIHGFTGTPAEMLPLGEQLHQEGWTVYCDLLPGFGAEILEIENFSRADWSDCVRKRWQEIQAIRTDQPKLLMGFSMGGAIALQITHESPPDGLVLFAPLTRWNRPIARVVPAIRHFVPSIRPYKGTNFDDASFQEKLYEINPTLDASKQEVRDFLENEIKLSTKVLYDVVTLGRDAQTIAPHIQTPTLIFQGGEDTTILPADTQRLANSMPNVVGYVQYPTYSHQLPRFATRHPYLFLQAILALTESS